MVSITVIGNQVDKALNKLKHKMNQEGILKEVKNRRYHETKSERRRRKSEEAQRRNAVMRRKLENYEKNSFQNRYIKLLKNENNESQPNK